MPRRTLLTAIAVVMVSLLSVRWAEAQATGRNDSGRYAGSSSSSPSRAGGFWDNQVRSFKSRWHLPGSPSKAARPAKKVVRRKKPARRVKKQTPVRHVSHQRPVMSAQPTAMPVRPMTISAQPMAMSAQPMAMSAQPTAGPTTIPWAAAPNRSQPADPANAGLVPGYPQFSGSMYPSPRPDVPYQVGGTVITNQALAPHEMLHPHEYRALYPPFYYKVRGHWTVTPFGVWSRDKWELEGTEVKVKYRPKISWLSGFMPTVLR